MAALGDTGVALELEEGHQVPHDRAVLRHEPGDARGREVPGDERPAVARLPRGGELLGRRVAEAVRSGQHIPSDQVPDQHNCRFGRWRDTISDATTLALPSFASLAEPHRGVHECGRHALLAAMKGAMPTANKMVAEMEQHSARILQCLEAFARAYPETIQPRATAPASVAA